MTLIIIDDCTHNKTFSVYDKPNGSVKILIDRGFTPNPKVHAYPPETDGSHADPHLQSSTSSPRTNEIREPPGIFGKNLIMEDD